MSTPLTSSPNDPPGAHAPALAAASASRHASPPGRPRGLAHGLVQALSDRIRDGRLPAGSKLPTEAAIVAEFGVSRTVVREALSRLQAAGMVDTRHGIGTFVIGAVDATPFRIAPEQLATLRDVVAVLELRIALETEAAALAAVRRTEQNLADIRAAVEAFANALAEGLDTVGPDYQFHLEIARATQNSHFAGLMATLGTRSIPRARLGDAGAPAESDAAALDEAERQAHRAYLARANAEHESICDAIANQDPEGARAAMRTHLANSRERRRRAAEGLPALVPRLAR